MSFNGIRTHQVIAQHYRIERELGRGGSAVVYRAYDMRHDRRVAIKVLHPELASALGAQRFLREIKTMAALQHPHIVPIFDSGETEDGLLYYVMPFVEADSLRRRIASEGPLPINDAVRVTREIAGALAFAHQHGILHRDIKPENILFLGGHACLTDFGIARPMRSSAERLTAHDIIVGTPEYMSPEQGRNRELDGRSDVYSLACVLYEMLAGVPPFSGDTPVDALQVRFSRTPPPVRTWRPEVSPALEEVLGRALATSPDERYDTAETFGDALTRAVSGGMEGPRRPATPWTKSRAMRAVKSPRTWMVGVVGAALVALAATPAVRNDLLGAAFAPLDSTTYVVLPFEVTGDAKTGPAGEAAARAVREAMESWKGIHVATDLAVQNASPKRLEGRWSLEDALDVARSLRAGRVLLGSVVADSNSLRVEAVVYDTKTGATRRESSAEFPVEQAGEARDGLSRLTTDLVSEGAVPRRAIAARGATNSLAAWNAYRAGHAALEQWKLAAAESAFAKATEADMGFAPAHVWLAQVAYWRRGPSVIDWRAHAQDGGRGALRDRDAERATAMDALARGDDPQACTAYRALIARDSLDATAWLGLGDCQAKDSIVVRDASSRSGWRFRGSYAQAMDAYERAVHVDRGAYAALPFGLVRLVLDTRANNLRRGRDASGKQYFGFLRLGPEGVENEPWPAQGGTGNPVPTAAVTVAGAHANADRLLRFAREWVRQVPSTEDGYEALAGVLEERGQLTATEDGLGVSALSALDSADARADDAAVRVRLAASRVRVLVKHEEFARAAALSDSVLAANPTPTPEVADWLVGLAALTGRPRRAGELDRIAGAGRADGAAIPSPLQERITRTSVEAAAGVCGEPLRNDLAALDRALEAYLEPSRRDSVRFEVTYRAYAEAVPCLGPSAAPAAAPQGDRMVVMQRALARHDIGAVRAILDTLDRARRGIRLGDVSMNYRFNEAWIANAIHDPRGLTALDLALNALPSLSEWAVAEPLQAAALGRAMAYRADLAATAGDRATARRWASAAIALWQHAEPSLDPQVRHLRALLAR